MQSYRTFLPHDKRGGFFAITGDKAPPKIHHAEEFPPISTYSTSRLRTFTSAFPRRSGSAREPRRSKRKTRNTKPFRRRRSRPGREQAEGQGRAIRYSPPPGSLGSIPSCAATRRQPGRCAPAWPCRAPRPSTRSCAPTRTKPCCATCASLFANRSRPRRTFCRYGAISPAGRPASTPARSTTPRPRSTLPWPSRSRLRKACGTTAGQGSGLGGREGRRRVLRLPGRPSGRSRDPRPLGVRPRHPATPAAASAADRRHNPRSGPAAVRGQGQASAPGRSTPRPPSPPPPPLTTPLP